MRYSKKEREENLANAREMLARFAPPGTRIYGVVRSVARSGMSRTIDFYAIDLAKERPAEDGPQLQYLTGWIATVLDYRQDRHGALKVPGCGMDMVFHVVNSLSYALHGREGAGGLRGGYTFRSEVL